MLPEKVTQAILDYACETGQSPKDVEKQITDGVLVVVVWSEDRLWLVFLSLNGL